MSPQSRFGLANKALIWSPVTESNRRPSPYHGDALPTELTGPIFTCLTWGFALTRRPPHHVAETASRTSVGELTVLLPCWRPHLEASDLSPRTIHLAPGHRTAA